jgi:hypothetical protein
MMMIMIIDKDSSYDHNDGNDNDYDNNDKKQMIVARQQNQSVSLSY